MLNQALSLRWDGAMLLMAALVVAGLLILGRARPLYTVLRAAAFLVLLWLGLEPSWTSQPGASGKPPLAVLVDVSKSMSIEDPRERLSTVKESLSKHRRNLEDDYEVSYYEFSETCAKTDWDGLMRAKARGEQTSISGALDFVSRQNKQAPTNVLLFSDGIDNGPQSRWSFDAPAFTVMAGQRDSLKDIALKDVRGADFAFKNRPVEFKVAVHHSGFKGKNVTVVLKEKKGASWTDIQSREILLADPSGAETVQFRMVPQAPGTAEYRVEAPLQEGEISRSNNALDFKLEVGREKIRVLYLCGQPSPEYAFLRQLLKSDPSIELVSFVILRNPENVVPVSEEQLSLIPFPAQDIFVRTLGDFDLLIFENFSYSRFGILPAHLENIERFVEEKGGGFVMIGGESSFSRGGYLGTAIERLLPVGMDSAREEVVPEEARLKVLEPQHPIFDTGESLETIESIWKAMPVLNGYHRLAGLKNGAALLASDGASGSPMIAAWQRKKGRVMAVAALSTWQWALGLSERGSLQSPYTHFWRQAVRWLTAAQDAKPIRVILSDSRFAAGRKIDLKLLIQAERLKGLAAPDLELSIHQQGKILEILPLTSAGRSEYRSSWTPAQEGDYEIRAVFREGSRKFEDVRPLNVGHIDLEMENPAANPAFLKEAAEGSGGRFIELAAFTPEFLSGKVKKFETARSESVRKALWLNPWVFGLLVALLIGEWGLRRYRGDI
ncbi:MAG: hypothetical protein A2901_01305 [Elusimicrobia bacterium RIFCSPLOWO2_01_FULL_54_10]|nr:MAG: hypothetical protein A2901_01305 [Elusimicrobia bacterium RIFCSPLOWO2_01_FULL_54_10]